jgi:hypothetical protein
MPRSPERPTLKSLHSEDLLNAGKLAKMRKAATEALLASLLPPSKDCLKTRRDGTILDGHHRIFVLRERGVDVDLLPRDVIERDQKASE